MKLNVKWIILAAMLAILAVAGGFGWVAFIGVIALLGWIKKVMNEGPQTSHRYGLFL